MKKVEINLDVLDTEKINKKSSNIDQLDTLEILKIINNEDKIVATAVEEQLTNIQIAVDNIYIKLKIGRAHV